MDHLPLRSLATWLKFTHGFLSEEENAEVSQLLAESAVNCEV